MKKGDTPGQKKLHFNFGPGDRYEGKTLLRKVAHDEKIKK